MLYDYTSLRPYHSMARAYRCGPTYKPKRMLIYY